MSDATATTFFITGASGFIGRNLCRRLLSAGHNIHALVRRDDAYLQSLGAILWLGDLWDENAVARAASTASVVVHCAGDAGFGDGPQYYRANVQLTEHLISTVKKHCATLTRFIFISTIGAIDRTRIDTCDHPLTETSPAAPTSDYGRSKLQAEAVVRQSGIPFVIVRPTLVVGADMRFDSHFAVFARHAIRRTTIGRIAWPGRFSVVHVNDLASALELVAHHPAAVGSTYFCSGETIALGDFFNQCQPNTWRAPISWLTTMMRPMIRWAPFSLKAMLLPALTASDNALRELGWELQYDAGAALSEVVARERARFDIALDPGGQTVITGAASGLGRALVELLAPLRKNLLIIDRDREGLVAVAEQFQNCRIVVVDLAVEAELESLVLGDAWKAAPISELYACAGIGLRGTVQETSHQAHKKMFDINVLARLTLGQHAVADMQRNQHGRLVLISSSSAFQPLPYMAIYAATNSALLSIGEAWAQEIADQGVQIMVACPGGMQTSFQKSGGIKEIEGEKLMSPYVVAQTILCGLNKNRTTLIISLRSFAMSMLARLLPRQLSARLWRILMEKMR